MRKSSVWGISNQRSAAVRGVRVRPTPLDPLVLKQMFNACMTVVKCRPFLHHCVVFSGVYGLWITFENIVSSI